MTGNPRRGLPLAALVALAGCGSIDIAPEPIIPTPLVTAMPVRVGVVLGGEQRNLEHNETRNGVEWLVRLGNGNKRLADQVFGAMFTDYVDLESLEAARAVPGLAAIFEPQMEDYSFATARETGGDYFAVTLRYRIKVYDPELQLVDSFTLTGYGNTRDAAMSSSKPLEGATRMAMRDAAAKILTQFPELPLGQQLAKGIVLSATAATTTAAVAEGTEHIATLPITDPTKRRR